MLRSLNYLAVSGFDVHPNLAIPTIFTQRSNQLSTTCYFPTAILLSKWRMYQDMDKPAGLTGIPWFDAVFCKS